MSACISPSEPSLQAPPPLSETSLARRLVELTQQGLPLLEDPWAWLAEQLGLSVESTLDLLKRLQDRRSLVLALQDLLGLRVGQVIAGDLGVVPEVFNVAAERVVNRLLLRLPGGGRLLRGGLLRESGHGERKGTGNRQGQRYAGESLHVASLQG